MRKWYHLFVSSLISAIVPLLIALIPLCLRCQSTAKQQQLLPITQTFYCLYIMDTLTAFIILIKRNAPLTLLVFYYFIVIEIDSFIPFLLTNHIVSRFYYLTAMLGVNENGSTGLRKWWICVKHKIGTSGELSSYRKDF